GDGRQPGARPAHQAGRRSSAARARPDRPDPAGQPAGRPASVGPRSHPHRPIQRLPLAERLPRRDRLPRGNRGAMTAPLGYRRRRKRLVRDAFVGKNAKAALGKPKSNRSGTRSAGEVRKPGAPGRIRTRDPLLEGTICILLDVAWCRLKRPSPAILGVDRSCPSSGVCRRWLPSWLPLWLPRSSEILPFGRSKPSTVSLIPEAPPSSASL